VQQERHAGRIGQHRQKQQQNGRSHPPPKRGVETVYEGEAHEAVLEWAHELGLLALKGARAGGTMGAQRVPVVFHHTQQRFHHWEQRLQQQRGKGAAAEM
jgi:hypothetical protein